MELDKLILKDYEKMNQDDTTQFDGDFLKALLNNTVILVWG